MNILRGEYPSIKMLCPSVNFSQQEGEVKREAIVSD